MRLLLDTNAYSDWRRSGRWNGLISRAAGVLMPTVVLGELHAGFRLGLAGRENIARLSEFLNAEPVKVVSPTERTAEIYGDFIAQLKGQGTPIPTNDVWISALAYEWRALLVSRDTHFHCLPQLAMAAED